MARLGNLNPGNVESETIHPRKERVPRAVVQKEPCEIGEAPRFTEGSKSDEHIMGGSVRQGGSPVRAQMMKRKHRVGATTGNSVLRPVDTYITVRS